MTPVCSPSLLQSAGTPRSAVDLGRFALLHDDSPENDPSCPDWSMWLKAAGASEVDASRGPRFNQASLVIEAAVLGRGVALAKYALAEADIKAGRLIPVLRSSLPVDFSYYLVAPRAKLNLPKVAHFREWLRTQVAEKPVLLAVA